MLVVCLLIDLCLLESMAAEPFQQNQKKFIYTRDGRPDPFLRMLSSKGLVKEMGPSKREEMMKYIGQIKVNGILWDDAMPVVMINSKMKKEGEEIQNLTVKEINPNGVILGYHDLTYEILLIKKKDFDDQGGIK